MLIELLMLVIYLFKVILLVFCVLPVLAFASDCFFNYDLNLFINLLFYYLHIYLMICDIQCIRIKPHDTYPDIVTLAARHKRWGLDEL